MYDSAADVLLERHQQVLDHRSHRSGKPGPESRAATPAYDRSVVSGKVHDRSVGGGEGIALPTRAKP